MASNVLGLNEANRYRQWSKRNRLREDCYVCGQWREITVLHHVLSFDMARELGCDMDRDLMIAAQSGVWLCPNHHAIIHLDMLRRQEMIGSGRSPDDQVSKLNELQAKELDLLSKIGKDQWQLSRRARTRQRAQQQAQELKLPC